MSRAKARFVEVNVSELYFTHSRVRPFFSGCGRKLVDTLESIYSGEMQLDALPVITILNNTSSDGSYFFSLNNRRLWVLKELYARGFFADKLVKVRIKECLPRERERYTIDKCSLTAKIMGESTGGTDDAYDETAARDEEDCSEELSEKVSHVELSPASGCEAGEKTKVKNSNAATHAAVAPLSSEAVKGAKALATSFKKAKGKNADRKVQSQIDEWIDSGVITAPQESSIWDIVRK